MDNIFQDNASSNIVFKLEMYEGSIHYLVQLCKYKGYDIKTVKISLLINQYLEFINGINNAGLDMDMTTDFLVTAATLLEIKARSALPQEQIEIEDDDMYEDPEELLRKRMIEHEMFAKQAQEIKQKETLNRFYRNPVFTDRDARITVSGFNLDKLMEAYAKVLYKFTREEEIIDVKTIEKDEFTVAQKIEFLVKRLTRISKIGFFELFDEVHSKNEVINTFLALLQVVSKQFAILIQEENFGDIYIERNSEIDVKTFDYTALAMEEVDSNE